MFQATELICEALLRKDIKCKIRETGGMSMVEVTFSGRNYASASLYFISNAEGNDVAVRAAELVKFPPERLPKLYDLQRSQPKVPPRQVRRQPRKKRRRCGNGHPQPLRKRRRGGEKLIRAVAILDEVYPKLMQATWA